jgi:hypothetical protein
MIESHEEFIKDLRDKYEVLLKSVAGKPMEFTEVLAAATFWMRVFYEAYGNDPVAQEMFESVISGIELGTMRIPHDTSGRVH